MYVDHSVGYANEQHNVLSDEFCTHVLSVVNAIGFKQAPIHLSDTTYYDPSVRNNERVILKDTAIYQHLSDSLDRHIEKTHSGDKLVRLNDLLRIYRYLPGMDFKPHIDNAYADDSGESRYTVLIYLNDVDEGGETCLITEPEINIKPEKGKALIFQGGILHEAKPIKQGVKYVLRTDAMYATH